jgi:hypothetical protein
MVTVGGLESDAITVIVAEGVFVAVGVEVGAGVEVPDALVEKAFRQTFELG